MKVLMDATPESFGFCETLPFQITGFSRKVPLGSPIPSMLCLELERLTIIFSATAKRTASIWSLNVTFGEFFISCNIQELQKTILCRICDKHSPTYKCHHVQRDRKP